MRNGVKCKPNININLKPDFELRFKDKKGRKSNR